MNKGITIKVWHALVAVGTAAVIGGIYYIATKVYKPKMEAEQPPVKEEPKVA